MKFLSAVRLMVACFLLLVFLVVLAACEPEVVPPPPPPAPPSQNQPPAIFSLVDERPIVPPFGSTRVMCVADDPDGDALVYTWSATGGNFFGGGHTVVWTAPATAGIYKITVTVTDGKGGSAEGSLTVSVLTNRPPVITSLMARTTPVLSGKTVDIVCLAADPDEDGLSYVWEADEGTVVGRGNEVVWVAPYKTGDYLVRVTVNDGKGGSTAEKIVLKVISPEKTMTLNLLTNESGSVYWDGFLTKDILAGDDNNNRGVRGYFSFDVMPLADTKVSSAKLVFFIDRVSGRPFTSLGQLHIERVDYGTSAPAQKEWDIDASPLTRYFESLPVEIDVTSQVDYLVRSANPRFQVRARFERVTDSMYDNSYILFRDATLTVTYMEE